MSLIPQLRNSLWPREPIRELTRIQSEFDRVMHNLIDMKGTQLGDFQFAPNCELTESKKYYTAKFEMPGIKKEDVKIEVDGNQLTVSAERSAERVTEDQKTHVSEMTYGSYLRSFTLPTAIDEKKVDAEFKNGILSIQIPKSEVSTAKQVAVH